MRASLLALLLLAAVVVPASSHARPTGGPQRVTMIGDSVPDAILGDARASEILGDGIDLRLDLEICRRLAVESCPDDGVRPPTVLDLVHTLGPELGSTVVVAVGYNDPEDEYAGEIDQVVTALHDAGVERILWLTLREVRHPYLTMNDAIRAKAATTPGFTVVDWSATSRTHPSWFVADMLHLEPPGALALAGLVRKTLGTVGAAPPVPALVFAPPAAATGAVGARLRAVLGGSGGLPPYRWKRVAGRLPKGVHVAAGAGRIDGVPTEKGRFRPRIRLTDAAGTFVERALALTIT